MFDKLKAKMRFQVIFKQGDWIRILLDKETGVNYLLINEPLNVCLTPLLGPDGKPVITKD